MQNETKRDLKDILAPLMNAANMMGVSFKELPKTDSKRQEEQEEGDESESRSNSTEETEPINEREELLRIFADLVEAQNILTSCFSEILSRRN